MAEDMAEVKKITPQNVSKIKSLYNEFKSMAADRYKFETMPLEFEQFSQGIIAGILKGFFLSIDDLPVAFLFFVVEEHGSVELNIIHISDDHKGLDLEDELITEFLSEIDKDKAWVVISYPMLGEQKQLVHKMPNFGFKLIGQAIVRFKLDDVLSAQIALKLQLPQLPAEYSIDSWKPQYKEKASEIIFESFNKAPDANFDPRFRTLDGCKKLISDLVNSQIGIFVPECTSVLLKNNVPVGICFGNLTTNVLGNIPLVGLLPSEQGKKFSIHLLKQTLVSFMKEVVNAKLDCMEVNATVETDNFPALHLYRKLGFKEDYSYPHAYIESKNSDYGK